MKTFEAWWNKSGDKAGDNKEIERRAFYAGQDSRERAKPMKRFLVTETIEYLVAARTEAEAERRFLKSDNRFGKFSGEIVEQVFREIKET